MVQQFRHTLPPTFTITGPILIAIWHVTSDQQVNQVTQFLNHVMAWDLQMWFSRINLQRKSLHWHCNGSTGILFLFIA
jgi:hypothetical protein